MMPTSKIILLLAFVFSTDAYSQNNSGDTGSKYNISDPRNPKCPCHVYQKLADREFLELKRNETNKKIHFSKNNLNMESKDAIKRKGMFSKISTHFTPIKAKCPDAKHKAKRKRRLFVKDIAACFYW